MSTVDVSLVRSFDSWHELKAATLYVVLGTAGAQQSVVNTHHFPWTTTDVTVDRTLIGPQGQAPHSLLVRQRGSNASGNVTIVIGVPMLIPGQRYLLFLTPTVIIPDVYYPVGSYQGVFVISKDDLVSSISWEAAQAGVSVNNAPLAQIVQAILGA
jgi:hypothetical protein